MPRRKSLQPNRNGLRWCPGCETEVPITEFKDLRATYCKTCEKDKKKKWNKDNYSKRKIRKEKDLQDE